MFDLAVRCFLAVCTLFCVAAMMPSHGWAGTVAAVTVEGQGEYTNAESLLIDGIMPEQETAFDDAACVFWSDPEVSFIIDLGAVFRLEGMTLQVDNNDDYLIEASLDGSHFSPILTVTSDMGEIGCGMETVGTDKEDPQFLTELSFNTMAARYIRLTASGGDQAYAASEVSVLGRRASREQ